MRHGPLWKVAGTGKAILHHGHLTMATVARDALEGRFHRGTRPFQHLREVLAVEEQCSGHVDGAVVGA